MAPEDHDLRRRLADFLTDQYESERESRLARDIACDPRTAKNILNQHWPNARHWAAIVRRFGRDVIEAVFSPEIDSTLARLAAEERELERKLQMARARRRQAQGFGPGRARRVEAPANDEDRATVTTLPTDQPGRGR
jgi:hypothetical protein